MLPLGMVLWSAMPMVMILITFTAYVIVRGGDALTAEKAFVSFALINSMHSSVTICF